MEHALLTLTKAMKAIFQSHFIAGNFRYIKRHISRPTAGMHGEIYIRRFNVQMEQYICFALVNLVDKCKQYNFLQTIQISPA